MKEWAGDWLRFGVIFREFKFFSFSSNRNNHKHHSQNNFARSLFSLRFGTYIVYCFHTPTSQRLATSLLDIDKAQPEQW